MNAETYVRMNTLLTLIPVGETTIKRWVQKNEFPKPKKLGPRVTGWKLSDLQEWQRLKDEGLPPKEWL